MNSSKHYLEPLGAALFLLALGVTIAQSTHGLSAIPGDLLDPRFNSVILEHVAQWLQGKQPNLWSPAFLYPFENILAFSDNHFGSVALYVLGRSLGFSREQSLTLWIAAGCCLNFFSSYWVLRKWSFSAFAAGAGAFVFTAALPALAWEEYSQLTYRFAIPLAIYSLSQFLQKRNFYYFLWLLIWVSEQFFCSIYLGFLLSLLIMATAIAYEAIHRDFLKNISSLLQFSKPGVRGLILATTSIIIFSACLYMLWKYHLVSAQYQLEGWSKEKILSMLPVFQSYFIADSSQLSSFVGRQISSVPWRHPQQLFMGVGVAVFWIAGQFLVWGPNNANQKRLTENLISLGKIAGISFFILFITTLKVGDFSFYSILLKIPGVSAIQFVTRVILVMLWPIALGVAVTCEYLWLIYPNDAYVKRGAVLLISITLLCSESFFYQHAFTPHSWWSFRLQTSERLIKRELSTNSIIFAKARIGEFESASALDAMILAQDLGIPTFSGYSGNLPFGIAYSSRDGCHNLHDRLQDYGMFAKADEATLQKLEQRGVIIDADPLQSIENLNIPRPPVKTTLHISNNQLSSAVKLVCGWDLESWGAWQTHHIARVLIGLPENKAQGLQIEVRALDQALPKPQTINLYINGIWVKKVVLSNKINQIINVAFNDGTLDLSRGYQNQPVQNLILEIHTSHLLSPQELGLGNDQRKLGIGITAMRFY